MSVCQICKLRDATVHVTQIVNGIKTDMQVCSQCAEKSGVKIDLNTLITGLLGFQNQGREIERNTIKCDVCGMTVKEFNSTGKMGCANCYETFFDPMQTLLNRMHGKTHHMGKTPKQQELAASEESIEQLIQDLQDELAACIKTEAYERAAEIRDRIRELSEKQKEA